MEGFLPLPWVIFWTLVALPFWVYGIHAMRKFLAEHPDKKLSLALSGAFVVIPSSLKIPSVTGSSSHPTGTGLGVMLSGPWNIVIICTIVLLFQATFLAHGGYTTLGANVFSMGIAGPFAAWYLYKIFLKRNVNPSVNVFIVAFVADIVTYLVTALQLTLIIPYAGMHAFMHTYSTFFGIFALTQIPLAIAEGLMVAFFFKYLADVRPDLVKGMGYSTTTRNTRGILSSDVKEGVLKITNRTKTRLTLISFALVTAVMMILAYFYAFFGDIGGADDAGAETVTQLWPGFHKLTDNIIQFSDFHTSILFLIQTAVGVLIVVYILYLFRKSKRGKEEEGQEGT